MMGGSIAIGLVLVKISGSIIEKKKLNKNLKKKHAIARLIWYPSPNTQLNFAQLT